MTAVRMTALVCTLLGALWVAGVVQARTPDELAALALTETEAGPGFARFRDDQIAAGPPATLTRALRQTSPRLMVLIIVLADDPATSPAAVIEGSAPSFAQGLSGLTLGERFAPAEYPVGSVARSLSGRVNGLPVAGVLVAWRAADVLAVLAVVTESRPGEPAADVTRDVVGLAARQREKLTPLASAVAPVGAISASAFPAGQADGLLGQSLSGLCHVLTDSTFTVTVARAETRAEVLGVTSQGVFVVTVLDVTNDGFMPDAGFSLVRLRDSRGRQYESGFSPAQEAQIRDYEPLLSEYGAVHSLTRIQPGFTERIVMVFQVPNDAEGFAIVPWDPDCRR